MLILFYLYKAFSNKHNSPFVNNVSNSRGCSEINCDLVVNLRINSLGQIFPGICYVQKLRSLRPSIFIANLNDNDYFIISALFK